MRSTIETGDGARPHADRRRAGAHPGAEPRRAQRAGRWPSTTATSPGTTSTASTSPRASASCCSRTRQELADIMLDRQLQPAAGHQDARDGGRAAPSIRIDGNELEPIGVVEHEDDLTTHIRRLHARRQDALPHLLRRPRQGGAARHGLGDGRRAGAGRAPQGRHRPRAAASRRRSWWRRPAPLHVTLDWIPLDEGIAADLKHLHGELPGEVDIADRTLDDSRWIVVASAAEAPATYHLYERNERQAHRAVRHAPGAQGLSAGADARRGHPRARRARARVVPDAAGRRRRSGRRRRCRWCCWCTAARGRATGTASTRTTSGWPIAAMPCCR